MASPRAAALLLAAVLVATASTSAGALTIKLDVLILTVPGWNIDFIEATLQGYGAPFTVVRYDASSPPSITDLLWAPDGSARFAGYYMYPNLEAMGYLNQSQVLALWDFQARAGARSVKFGAWPTNVGFAPNLTGCGSSSLPMAFTPATPFGTSGVVGGGITDLASDGLYRCPGLAASPLPTCSMWASDFASTGLHTACNSTPIVMIGDDVGGTLVNYADGRQSMAFVFDCAAWTSTCMVIGHLSLNWLLQTIIPGERRATLSPQFEFEEGLYAGNLSQYRATVPDLMAHVAWRTKMLPTLPAGSDIKFDLPFNGNGILEQVSSAQPNSLAAPIDVDDRSCIDMPEYAALNCSCWFVGTAACPQTAPQFCRNCTKGWKKPLGSGTNRSSVSAATSYTSWTLTDILAGDPLAAFVANAASGFADAFFLQHHTFSHENLDNATAFDTDVQIDLNQRMAISGLRNGDALASLAAHGVSCGAVLLNTAAPHHMLYTTSEVNGFEGFAILPRFATEVYYNCSTPAQNVALYNKLYSGYYGGPSTIDQIMQREAVRVVREGILKLRHDPYMFHQANLAILDGTGKSLAIRWLEAVLSEMGRYVSWPVVSLTMDNLRAAFEARQARDACRLSYALEVDASGAVAAVTVSSAAPAGAGCSAPLMAGRPTATSVPVPSGGTTRMELAGVKWALPPPPPASG